MTKAQESTVGQLREALQERWFNSADYEFKTWNVQQLDREHVVVKSTIGRINDEGTLAQSICRERHKIYIGLRGGCAILKLGARGKLVKVRGFRNCVAESNV